jgi:hypothetical protein
LKEMTKDHGKKEARVHRTPLTRSPADNGTNHPPVRDRSSQGSTSMKTNLSERARCGKKRRRLLYGRIGKTKSLKRKYLG